MNAPVNWTEFAITMRAIGAQPGILPRQVDALRARCLTLHHKHGIDPAGMAFAMLSYLENGTRPETVLRFPEDRLRARLRRIEGMLYGYT